LINALVAKNLCDYGQLHVVGMACGFVCLLWVVKKFELAVCCLVEEEDAHEFKVERWSKKALAEGESGCDISVFVQQSYCCPDHVWNFWNFWNFWKDVLFGSHVQFNYFLLSCAREHFYCIVLMFNP
jgi:hypothetical protein